MSQYVKLGGVSDRAFIIEAVDAYHRNEDGTYEKISDPTVISKETTATDFVPSIEAVQANSALSVENILNVPTGSDTEAVVASLVVRQRVGKPGETSAGNAVPGHVIAGFFETEINAPTGDAFGIELRLDPLASTLDQYVGIKHVIGPDTQNDGTVGTYILEQLDDMRTSVTSVAAFQQNFLDPRLVTTHAGGNMRPTEQLTASQTLTNAHSGKDYIVVSATDVTITLGAGVTNGWHGSFVQGGAGKVTIAVTPDKAIYSKASQVQTAGQLGKVDVTVYPFGATVLYFTAP